MENFENNQHKSENEVLIDEFIIGEGFSIADDKKEDRVNTKKGFTVNWKIMKPVLWIVAIIGISILLAIGILSAATDYLGIGPGRDAKQIQVEIPEDSNLKEIADALYNQGIITNKFLFKMYSKIKNYDDEYKSGVYVLSNQHGYSGIADVLINEGKENSTVKVRIPEMATIDEIVEILIEKGIGTKESLKRAINETDYEYDFLKDIPNDPNIEWRLEGYLFPDTYIFYNYDTEECARFAIDKMLATTNERFTEEMRSVVESKGYTMHEALTLASMVEMEAGGSSNDDKQMVAEVFYNRLRKYGKTEAKLESDPTVFYPYGDGAYNTRETKGIPPGPMCAPSLDSIKAVIYPATDHPRNEFFVTDKNMKFYYSKTYQEHLNRIQSLKDKGIYYRDEETNQ